MKFTGYCTYYVDGFGFVVITGNYGSKITAAAIAKDEGGKSVTVDEYDRLRKMEKIFRVHIFGKMNPTYWG